MIEERKGELYIFSGALTWSLFPIITVLSYKAVPSFISLAVSTFFASVVFFAIVLYKNKLHELKNIILWKYVLGIVLFIGVLYYVFNFYGLTKTTPGNASIIGLFEVYTSYILFHVIRKEPFSFESKIGSALMILGAIIVLAPNFSKVNSGDLFILMATFVAPFGNLLQQKAKKISSTETILFLRSIIAAPIILLIAYTFRQNLEILQVKDSLIFLLINGIFILGLSKIFWLEGISRISVTKSNALSSIAPLLTLFFAWLIFKQVPTWWQVTAFVPFFLGTLLLTDNLKLKYQNIK
ncbi:MAG: DMT family transporter [bacterium]|nr:DMT family transporter [bacterium]